MLSGCCLAVTKPNRTALCRPGMAELPSAAGGLPIIVVEARHMRVSCAQSQLSTTIFCDFSLIRKFLSLCTDCGQSPPVNAHAVCILQAGSMRSFAFGTWPSHALHQVRRARISILAPFQLTDSSHRQSIVRRQLAQ